PASFGTPQDILGQDRVLAIAVGRFDQKKIAAYALRTGKQTAAGTQTVYEVPGNPPVSFMFLSPTRIALAGGRNATELLSRVDVSAASSRREPAMQSRIQRVAGAPLFAVARTDHLPPSLYSSFSSSPQLEQLARSVQVLSFAGQPDGDNLKVTLDAESDSLKNAVQIAFLLETGKMAGSIALSDPHTRRQMTKPQVAFLEALLNRTSINHQNKIVRLTLEITPEMLAAAPSTAAAPRIPSAPRANKPPPAAYPHSSR
ncbi:MAG: hypothetical protein WA192_19880, partial [Candidatus Acidiferrales bacterium]